MLTHRCRREQFCQRGKLTLVSTLFSVHHTPNQAGSSRMLLSEGATVSSGATRESHYWPWSPTTLISHPNPQPQKTFSQKPGPPKPAVITGRAEDWPCVKVLSGQKHAAFLHNHIPRVSNIKNAARWLQLKEVIQLVMKSERNSAVQK